MDLFSMSLVTAAMAGSCQDWYRPRQESTTMMRMIWMEMMMVMFIWMIRVMVTMWMKMRMVMSIWMKMMMVMVFKPKVRDKTVFSTITASD